MEGPEPTGEKVHICVHEDDLEQHREDLKNIRNELKKDNNLLEFIKDELKILKDAVGVKNEENGARDKQLKEIRQKTDEIGEVKEKNETLFTKVHNIELNMVEITTTLGLNKQAQENKDKLRNIIIGALIGAAFTFIFTVIISEIY